MNRFFAWGPLAPPVTCRQSLAIAAWADRGAFIFLGLGLLQVAVGLVEGWVRFIPMAIGLLFFGLPHGAIDHLVALGLAGKSLRALPLSIVLLLYLSAAMAVFALWIYLPVASAIGFLIITIYHWGKGDLAFEHHGFGQMRSFRGSFANSIHLILRGIIPIGLPFIVFPEQAFQFIDTCVQFFAPSYEIEWHFLWKFVFAAFILFFSSDLWLHLRHFREPLARRIIVENFALVLFFFFVPPLIAIGWYFAGWHGLRHLLRLTRYQSSGGFAALAVRARMTRLGWQALPFSLVSVVMLAGMFIWMADRVAGSFEGTALYLVLISALTLPHLIIVEWMDHRESMAKICFRNEGC